MSDQNTKDRGATGNSDLKEIIRISEIWNSATPRNRTASYACLKAIYRTYVRWKNRPGFKKRVAALARAAKVTVRANTHPIRILIEATNPSLDEKVASRWTRALEYAESREVDPNALRKHFAKNGGIAGCARLASEIDPRRTKDRDDWSD